MGDTNVNESDRRIQWHEAFVAAMKLELKDYAEYISFSPEYELTGRPKYIDMVMIKDKNKALADEDAFAGIFSRYNIIDYKGVGDRLDMTTLAKGFAYVGMYIYERGNNKSVKYISSTKSNEYANYNKTDIDILEEFKDTTLVFIRKAKPVKLLAQLKDINCHIAKTGQGVYTINVAQLFRVQIIVTREISFDRHPWLCALTRNLDEQQAGMLVELEKQGITDWEYANAEEVMDVVMRANREVFESVIGGNEDMCRAMWELMKPQIDAYVAEKDETIAQQGEKLAEQDETIAEKDETIAEKNETIAKKDAEIDRLKALLMQFSVNGSTIR